MLNRNIKQNITIGFAVFVVLMIAGVAFLGNATGYLVYENQSRKFSLQYPKNWIVLEKPEGGAEVAFLSPKETALDIYQEHVNIVVQGLTPNTKDLESYTAVAIFQLKLVFEDKVEILFSGSGEFAGQPAHKFEYILHMDDGHDMRAIHIWTLTKRLAYQFNYLGLAPSYDKYLSQVNQMADSFKILK